MAIKDHFPAIDNIRGGGSVSPFLGQDDQPTAASGSLTTNDTNDTNGQTKSGVVSGETSASSATPSTTTQSASQPTGDYTQGPLTRVLQAFMPDLDPERMKKEIEADKKREKRQAIFAAIGDGISALTNLYFTTKGAPSMFDASKGSIASHKSYWDKVKADRDKKMKEQLNLLLNAAGMDQKAAHDQWLRDNTEKQQAFDNDLKSKDEARKAETHEYNKIGLDLENQLAQGKVEEQGYVNKAAKAKADRADETVELGIQKQKADIDNTKASSFAHRAQGQAALTNASTNKNREERANYTTFSFGDEGLIDIPNSTLHSAELSRLYSMLPADKQKHYEMTVLLSGKDLDEKAMLRAIGAEAATNDEIKKELYRLSRANTKTKTNTKTNTKTGDASSLNRPWGGIPFNLNN